MKWPPRAETTRSIILQKNKRKWKLGRASNNGVSRHCYLPILILQGFSSDKPRMSCQHHCFRLACSREGYFRSRTLGSGMDTKTSEIVLF